MYSFNTKTNRYHVVVHGNGWAYEITSETGDSLWFQDDEAHQIKTFTSNFDDECAISQYFDCLFN